MKLLLVLATAISLAAAGSRSYRNDNHNNNHHSRHSERERRGNLDYDDIETADQDQVERFDEPTERKVSNRVGVYSTVHSIQVSKNKAAQRRHSKLASIKDSEASGTHYEGTPYASHAHYAAPQVQQIHTHELLTSQGLVPIYQNQLSAGPPAGNVILTGGLGGIAGLTDPGHHQALNAHAPLILTGGAAGHPGAQLIAANPSTVGPVGPPLLSHPENDLGTDITKSVYVFSAPPDPFDYVPRQTISKIPTRPQKHYQVLFINAPSPPPPQQHHVELPPPPELKTLVYVLVKKPPPPAPINFIKAAPPLLHHNHKPEVYFIRYKNKGLGGLPQYEEAGPAVLPVGHPGAVQYAPIAPQEELRGNIDYGPTQYEAAHHPYQLEEYQDDPHLAASQVLSQRSSGRAREVDAGVSGI